ncbi:MAG: SH3 domain-containing protein [Chloroflexi bacterium]|nr:SH3 domain-containing protein [Chloroflexota bacterium]MCC6895094.1 hypothetical protein [Anaerolineae bacterium]
MFKRLIIPLLLLVLMLLAGLSSLVSAQTAIPTLTPIPTITPLGFVSTPAPTMFYVITLTPLPTPGCAAPLPLVKGQEAYVSGGLYVRNEPNESSPWVNYYQRQVIVTIVDGPICSNQRYNWWKVSGPGNDGWVAEGTPAQYWMRPGPPPAGTFCPDSADLTVGQETRLRLGVKVREQANIDGLVLTVAPMDSVALVLEGPRCANGYNWWRIQVTVLDVVYTGWAADGFEGAALLEDPNAVPTETCYSVKNLRTGLTGYVQYIDEIPKNMRVAPDLQSEVAATLLDGIGFTIIGGPVCADGYNWWQIQILSRPDVTGWFAENWISAIKPEKQRPV